MIALIAAGANVNAKNRSVVDFYKRKMETPLHKAKNYEIVDALIAAGSFVNVKTM